MTRRPQARAGHTRDRLLAAGRAIVAEVGQEGLRTDAVVARAGTAKGTFFAHFPDRDHFLAVLLAERLQAELSDLSPPLERAALHGLLARLFDNFAADAVTVALLARFSGPAGASLGLDEVLCTATGRLAEGLAAMARADLLGNGAPPEVLAEGILAMVFHAAASAQCAVPGEAAADKARALLTAMVEALLWPPG